MIEILAATYGAFVCMYGVAIDNSLVFLTGFIICYLSYRNMKE